MTSPQDGVRPGRARRGSRGTAVLVTHAVAALLAPLGWLLDHLPGSRRYADDVVVTAVPVDPS